MKRKQRNRRSWDEMYALLVAYKKKHGHTNVPQREKERTFLGLGIWVSTQRRRKKQDKARQYAPITQNQIDQLDEIGFVWDLDYRETLWNEKFERLQQFQLDNGHCDVSCGADPQLGTWASRQRTLYHQGDLRSDRKELLNSIGFSWIIRPSAAREKNKLPVPVDAPEDALKRRVQQQWDASCDRLVEFKRTHGHWKVPQSYAKDTSLANWIEAQRNNRQSMPPKRVERLNVIGFPWNNDDGDGSAADIPGVDSTDYETASEMLEHDDAKPRARDASASSDSYPIGTKVKKFVEGSGWWSGKVSSYDGKDYIVEYDGGYSEEYTAQEMAQIVLSPDLAQVEVGSRVAVLWSDDEEYYSATVTRERNTKKRPFNLTYDDGETEWIDLRQHKFRVLEGKKEHCSDAKYPVGTKVKKFFEGSGWWTGEVSSYDGEKYRVIYEDGEMERCTAKELEHIVLTPELSKVEIGASVAVQWPNDGKYYNGRITREQNTRKPFCVVYENNEYEWIDFRQRKFRLLESKTRRRDDVKPEARSSSDKAGTHIMSSQKRYAIGTKVKKFFEGMGWYTGEVMAYKGPLYRVIYEDEEIEECNHQELSAFVVTPELEKVECGSRLAVLWPADNTFYEATVTRERNAKKRFCLEYDNGEDEWVDLQERKFRLLKGGIRRRKEVVLEEDSESDTDDDSLTGDS